jgi:hypothetical protein
MEGLITLSEVKSGEVDVIDLLKINALMDMKAALEKRAMEQSKQ